MNRLKERREALGLRREEVAARAGISLQHVRNLEKDHPPIPGLDIARRVAEALRATVDELFPVSA